MLKSRITYVYSMDPLPTEDFPFELKHEEGKVYNFAGTGQGSAFEALAGVLLTVLAKEKKWVVVKWQQVVNEIETNCVVISHPLSKPHDWLDFWNPEQVELVQCGGEIYLRPTPAFANLAAKHAELVDSFVLDQPVPPTRGPMLWVRLLSGRLG
jgi:hypothetical protein